MKTIYLIRHGQKHKHPGDPELTELGITQAKEAGNYLKQFPLTNIIASPMTRTRQTAKHIQEILKLEHEINDDLMERMNWDSPEITKEEFITEWSKTTHDRDYTPKYGDSSYETGKRLISVIANTDEDSHTVLVTHGGAIVDLLRNIFSDEELQSLKHLYPTGQDFQMFNCSINKIELGNDQILKLLNYIDHLDEVT